MGRSVVRLWPRGGLWRHADFLKLWSAQTISQFGSQVSGLAIPLTAILILDASAFEVSVLAMVEFAPFLLFTLPAGVWVDRLPRRPILAVADLGRAAALVSIPVAYALDALTLWQLFVAGFAVGTLTVFFDVSYQSYLPSLVGRGQLMDGNSKLEVSRTGAQMAGPGVAGLLIGALKAPYAILVDAISFLGSAAFLFAIGSREEVPAPTEKPSMRRELWEGLTYLVRHPYWRPIAITTATSNFCSNVAFTIFLVYAVRRLDLTPGVIGLTFTLGSIGALAGALAAQRVSRRLGIGPTMLGAALVFGPATLLVPLAPPSFPVPLLVVSGALSGFGIVLYNVTGLSFQQAITPERMLGRLNASRRFVVWGTIPLGQLASGGLASWIGLRPTLFAGAIGACFTFLPIAFSPLRRVRTEADVPEPLRLAGDGILLPAPVPVPTSDA
jgi:MFS family permease